MMAFLKPNFQKIPEELKALPQWVCWKEEQREGKLTKPPYKPQGGYAESNNPLTWSTFEAVKAAVHRFDGIGFVVAADDPFTGIDFDHCRCPAFDRLTLWANSLDVVLPEVADHIKNLNSYTEVSPSGKGIRAFVKGKLPVDGKKKGDFEVYQAKHYMTITGHVLDGFPRTIESRQMEVEVFYKAVFGSPEEPPEHEKKHRQDNTPFDWKVLREKAFQSVNGAEIEHLWKGDFSAYPSQSEADLVLCSRLAFWLGGDAAAIDAAFRESGLYRDKWNVKHHGDGRTYGEGTIQKALDGCTSFYGDHHSQEKEPKETTPPEIWQEPIPFNDYSRLPEFPVKAIPGICGQMVQALADSCQVDLGLPGSMMLAVLSAAIGEKVQVVTADEVWTHPAPISGPI